VRTISNVFLGDVVDIIGGGTPPKNVPSYWNGSIPWASIRDLKTRYISETEHSITPEGLKSCSTNLIPAGAVIIASRVGLGKAVQALQDTAINQDLRGLLPKKDGQISHDFLFYWAKAKAPEIIAAGSGATVQGVRLEFLRSLQFPLLTYEEQTRVVSALDRASEVIASLLQDTKNLLLQTNQLFGAFLDTSIEDAIREYGLKPASELLDVRDGTHDSPKFLKQGFPFITSKNLKNGSLDFSNVKYISDADYSEFNKRSKVDSGDMLFGMIGTIGNPVVVKTSEPFAIKNVALFKANDSYNLEFLRYYYSSPKVSRAIEDSTRGTTQRFVGLGNLRNFPIPNIPKGSQDDLESRFSQAEKIYKELQLLLQDKERKIVELQSVIFENQVVKVGGS
jgi:restriction endonuclease S subunit